MNTTLARALAAAAATASLLAPSAAFASDGTIRATVSRALTQLAAHETALTRLEGLLAPGTPAAELKAAARPAISQGTVLSAAARNSRAALARQKPSTPKGAAAKATCLGLLAGTARLATALVSWGKAASAGKPSAALAQRLQTGAAGLLRNGIACQTAASTLK